MHYHPPLSKQERQAFLDALGAGIQLDDRGDESWSDVLPASPSGHPADLDVYQHRLRSMASSGDGVAANILSRVGQSVRIVHSFPVAGSCCRLCYWRWGCR